MGNGLQVAGTYPNTFGFDLTKEREREREREREEIQFKEREKRA